MSASVIVPTFNGSKKLPILLNALLKQTYQQFQLIVVVDGSQDATLDVLHSFRNRFRHDTIFFNQPNKGRSAAKNQGARLASGEILIFYDDDMEPASCSVEQHIQFHKKYEGIVCGNPIEHVSASKTDIQNYKANLTVSWTEKYKSGLNPLGFHNVFFTSANCSFRKSFFENLKGFDERINDAEDLDIACRALELQVPVYFDKSNTAYHHDPIDCVHYIKRLRQYDTARKTLAQLHPSRMKASRNISFGKKLLYKIFASPFWPQAIDRGYLSLLPRKLRYKFYDVVIQSLAIENPRISL